MVVFGVVGEVGDVGAVGVVSRIVGRAMSEQETKNASYLHKSVAGSSNIVCSRVAPHTLFLEK